MATDQAHVPAAGELTESGERRRDFIYIATGAFAAVGAATVAWPLINQMNPSADVLALASIDVDLAAIKPGQAIKCKPEEVARVGHAMRKWIKENDLPYIYRLQARYHSDGMGRLWLLDAPQKAETTKLKKVA